MAGGVLSMSLTALSFPVLGCALLFSSVADIVPLAVFCIWRLYPIVSGLIDGRLIVPGVLITAACLAATFICKYFPNSSATAPSPPWDGPSRPLLFPCVTTHSRLFPKKHSFTYSYLVVGIPVGWEGNVGGLVSSGIKARNGSDFQSRFSLKPGIQRSWYDVDPADYLERGNSHLGLRGKLDGYLKTQGVDPSDYPHAYLITAARFLGYHFNPASFWYLYDAEKSLAAMIVEVNNTFDERRMYFLTDGRGNLASRIQGPSDTGGSGSSSGHPPAPSVIKKSWPKDFHVSPFNSRRGSYALSATDPLAPSMSGSGRIDNSITLKSSKGHAKIVARLFSSGPAIDPATLAWWQKIRFLLPWWWVGLVTFPRIVKEAALLFFQRKLHVWYRPEPLRDSIGRTADTTERSLEPVFRRYLRHLVEGTDIPVALKYVPSGIPEASEEVMLSGAASLNNARAEQLEFKVLTPVFYARFTCYAHDLEAMFCELRESCTVWVSRPELLPNIFLKKPSPTLKTSSYLNFAYFSAIQYLRRRPEPIVRPLTSSASAPERPRAADIRDFRLSSMDGYVLAREHGQIKSTYRSRVLEMFVADRISLGSVPLLNVQRLVIQTWMAWAISRSISWWMAQLLSYP